MNKKIKGIIVVSIVLAIGVGSFFVLTNPTKPANVSEPMNGELDIRLGLEKDSYQVGEDITFKSFVKNSGATGKSYSFNSTCTQGTIYIDEQPTQLIQACGQAITGVDVGAYKTITYNYPFVLVSEFSHDASDDFDDFIEFEGELKLSSGQHQAKLKWQDFESNLLTFNVE